MKIKSGFVLKAIADSNIVVPLGSNVVDFSSIIKLSDTGAFLWSALECEREFEELLDLMLTEYDVQRDVAVCDINAFIEKLKEHDLIE